MGSFAAGSIVLVHFPFSDLSQSKLRPAVVLADCGRDDWLLCQITSNSYGDLNSVTISDTDLWTGSLQIVSYARPLKLFTAHESLISTQLGVLRNEAFNRIAGVIIESLKPN